MLKHCLAVGLTLLTCLPATSLASDRLNQAALEQKQAQNSVLLSIKKAGNNLVAVGEQGTVVTSNDGAKSWLQAKVPVSTLLTRVAFADEKNGWAVGHDGVVLTTSDAGMSWTKQLDGNGINDLIIEALKAEYQSLEQQLELSDEELEGRGLDRSDLEEAYENLEYGIEDADIAKEEGATIPLLDIAIIDNQNLYIAGAYGLLLQSSDGGKSWRFIGHKIPNPEKFHINRFLIAKDGNYYIAGESGLLLQSSDQSATWQEMDSPYSGSWYNLIYADHLYAMGLRGHLYRLQGGQWQAIKLPQTSTINDAIWRDNQLFLIGNAGLLLKLSGDQVTPMAANNGSYSEGLVDGEQLILVGENGVKTVSLAAESK